MGSIFCKNSDDDNDTCKKYEYHCYYLQDLINYYDKYGKRESAMHVIPLYGNYEFDSHYTPNGDFMYGTITHSFGNLLVYMRNYNKHPLLHHLFLDNTKDCILGFSKNQVDIMFWENSVIPKSHCIKI